METEKKYHGTFFATPCFSEANPWKKYRVTKSVKPVTFNAMTCRISETACCVNGKLLLKFRNSLWKFVNFP